MVGLAFLSGDKIVSCSLLTGRHGYQHADLAG